MEPCPKCGDTRCAVQDSVFCLGVQTTTLRAENERLMGVLRVIELTAGLVSDHSRVCADIVVLARAALKGGK